MSGNYGNRKQYTRDNQDYLLLSEYRLLNSIIFNSDYSDDPRIDKDIFSNDLSKNYYEALIYLLKNDIPVTPASLTQKANEKDYNASLEISKLIFDIDKGTNSNGLDETLKVLREHSKVKQIINKAGDFYKKLKTSEILDLGKKSPSEINQVKESFKAEVLTSLYQIEQLLDDDTGKNTFLSLNDWITTYETELKDRLTRDTYTFGDELLDKACPKGPYPGSYSIVAGVTGMGKSVFAENILNNCINQEIPCAYFSPEMSGNIMMDRLMANRLNIPSHEFNNKDSIPSLLTKIAKEKANLVDRNMIYFDEDPDVTLSKIHNKILRFKQKSKKDYVLIIIDLLTQVKEFTTMKNGLNLAQAIELAVNELNIMVKTLGCHVLGVVQFNRSTDSEIKIKTLEDVWDCRPSLGSIKNAGALAERARLVLGAFRPRYYIDKYLPEDEKAAFVDDVMEIQVLKQNDGKTPRIKYMFEGDICKITPILEEDYTYNTGESSETKQAEDLISGKF